MPTPEITYREFYHAHAQQLERITTSFEQILGAAQIRRTVLYDPETDTATITEGSYTAENYWAEHGYRPLSQNKLAGIIEAANDSIARTVRSKILTAAAQLSKVATAEQSAAAEPSPNLHLAGETTELTYTTARWRGAMVERHTETSRALTSLFEAELEGLDKYSTGKCQQLEIQDMGTAEEYNFIVLEGARRVIVPSLSIKKVVDQLARRCWRQLNSEAFQLVIPAIHGAYNEEELERLLDSIWQDHRSAPGDDLAMEHLLDHIRKRAAIIRSSARLIRIHQAQLHHVQPAAVDLQYVEGHLQELQSGRQ